MKTLSRTVEIVTYASELHPEMTTEHAAYAETLAWADANPKAWKIVMTSKSKAFGLGSSQYLGCTQRGNDPASVIGRLAAFRAEVEKPGETFHSWKARYTLARFGQPGFTGGMFVEHARWTDGKVYPRGCSVCDYTPATLEEVLDRFDVWTKGSYENRTEIMVDGVSRRRLA